MSAFSSRITPFNSYLDCLSVFFSSAKKQAFFSIMTVRESLNLPIASNLWHALLYQSDTGQSITNWADKSGEFKRGSSQFRNHISKESGADFPPERGRYHLYVSYACPWGLLHLIMNAWCLHMLSQFQLTVHSLSAGWKVLKTLFRTLRSIGRC